MNRSDAIRHEQQLAEEARPIILEQLRRDADRGALARDIAARFSVELTKAFRWVQYIDEDYQRKRRRIVRAALAVVWVGVLVVLATVALSLLGIAGPVVWWRVGIAAGVPLVVFGGVGIRIAGRLVRLSV